MADLMESAVRKATSVAVMATIRDAAWGATRAATWATRAALNDVAMDAINATMDATMGVIGATNNAIMDAIRGDLLAVING